MNISFAQLREGSADTEQTASFFDLDRVCFWVENGKYQRVAVQFADDLIFLSLNIVTILRERLPSTDIQLLADSTLGNCCVDAVSALHVSSNAIIHFGHSCLFPVDNTSSHSIDDALYKGVSVLFVFCNYSFDFSNLLNNCLLPILSARGNGNLPKVLLIYDCIYHAFISKNGPQLPSDISVAVPIIEPNSGQSLSKCHDGKNCVNMHFCRRCIVGVDKLNDVCSIVYIGSQKCAEFMEIMLTFLNKGLRITVFDPSSVEQSSVEMVSHLNRALGRRFYYVERVRDAASVGLVVSASSAAAVVTKTALEYAKHLLKKVGKTVYVFCLGSLTPTKLAAYTEVDAFVFLGCPERAVQVNSSDFYRPVVTFAEMEMACNTSRPLDYRFVPDLTELLPDGSCYILQTTDSSIGADISLVSNRSRGVGADIQKQEDGITESFAGERLAKRLWKGLDASDTGVDEEKTNVIRSGRRGIPIRYEDEIPKNN